MNNTITNTTALIEDITFTTTTKEQSTMNTNTTITTPSLVLDNEEVSLMDKVASFIGEAIEWTEHNTQMAAVYTGNNIIGFTKHVEEVVVTLVVNAPAVRASAKELARQRMAAAYAARGITMK